MLDTPDRLWNRSRSFAAVALVASLLLGSSARVAAQSGPTDFNGRTAPTSPVPKGVVDGGLILFAPDSDHDGMPDDVELANGTDPLDPADADADPDGDGITNGDELRLGTNPRNPDTDGDGYPDGQEVQLGFDPLDPASHPSDGSGLARIEVTPGLVGLEAGSVVGPVPVQLRVTGVLGDGSTVDLTANPTTSYASENASIAIVDAAGRVYANAAGTTGVVVRSGAASARATVVVTTRSPYPAGEIRMPGYANDVAVRDGRAYVAAGAAGLQIVDVSVPYAPSTVGSLALGGAAFAVSIAGAYAYVATSSGLSVVNVTDPASPWLASSLDVEGASDVTVVGTRAYLAAGSNGLVIVDVSAPASPTVAGALALAGATSVDVAASGATAAVAVEGGGLALVDVSDPALPIRTALLPSVGNGYRVTFGDGVVYLTTNQGIVAVDAADPAAPIVLPATSLGGPTTDIARRGAYAFVPTTAFPSVAAQALSLSSPGAPAYLGFFDTFSEYDKGTAIAADDGYLYMTASRNLLQKNGWSGDTTLFVLRWNGNDAASRPPDVAIASPATGVVAVAGDVPLPVRVVASDSGPIAGVEVRANGATLATFTAPPYVTSLPVPVVGDVTLVATAIDETGTLGTSASVTVHVVADDPGTTVVGRVVDAAGGAISDAVVSFDGTSLTAVSAWDGSFALVGAPSVPYRAPASVTAVDGSGSRRGRSIAVPTVRGGTTDLGVVVLSAGKTTSLPVAPSAFGSAKYDGDQFDDVFVGFPDRQSLVYTADGFGGYAPDLGFPLPFATVRSGSGGVMNDDGAGDLVAQSTLETATATVVYGDGLGGVSSTVGLATGLAAPSDRTIGGREWVVGEPRPIVGFVANGATSATVSVRFGRTDGTFDDPLTLSLPGSLRTVAFVDVDSDGMLDVLATRRVAGVAGSLVLFRRSGPTSFAPPVEYPIVLRSADVSGAVEDFAFVSSNLVVLGDDRLRVYGWTHSAGFRFLDETLLPSDLAPIGIAAANFYSGTGIAVVARDGAGAGQRALILFRGFFAPIFDLSRKRAAGARGLLVGFGEPEVLPYTIEPGVGDVHVTYSEIGGASLFPDIVVVEGRTIRTFLDGGPYNGGS